jgi:hypothetical protein
MKQILGPNTGRMPGKVDKKEAEYALQRNGYTIYLTERELGLIANCQTYATDAPAGLPGHNIMLIVAKLAGALDIDGRNPEVPGRAPLTAE